MVKRQIQAKLLIKANRFTNYEIENKQKEKGGELGCGLGRGTSRLNRVRMSRMSQCPRSQSDRKESLYDQSLQKGRGRKERNEF